MIPNIGLTDTLYRGCSRRFHYSLGMRIMSYLGLLRVR